MRYFIAGLAVIMIGFFGSGSGKAQNLAPPTPDGYKTAIFAGGCFWCMESPFEKIDGVTEAVSGYIGGHVKNPTYKQVSSGGTGHFEAIRVTYDPKKVSYKDLLEVFWPNIDPLDASGQFCDKGDQYRAAIFYSNEEEESLAKASKTKKEKQLGEKIVTGIIPASDFYDAEDYHQNYYIRNSFRYNIYRSRCGRDKRLHRVWGDEATGKH